MQKQGQPRAGIRPGIRAGVRAGAGAGAGAGAAVVKAEEQEYYSSIKTATTNVNTGL